VYLSVPFVGDARNLNFFPSHVVVVAAVVADGGAADAYFAASARASADFSSPSFGHFQNVMSLAQSEIPVILNLFYLLIFSSIFFLGFLFGILFFFLSLSLCMYCTSIE
jgi:hypothetical protein